MITKTKGCNEVFFSSASLNCSKFTHGCQLRHSFKGMKKYDQLVQLKLLVSCVAAIREARGERDRILQEVKIQS